MHSWLERTSRSKQRQSSREDTRIVGTCSNMAAWSTLIRSASQNLQKARILQPKLLINNAVINSIQARGMSHTFSIQPTRWQWHKTKDMFHFYFMVAAIPLSIITFCANIFIGPATLTPIPEGYEPKHWEYYRSPITRFFARYIFHTPQKDYEKTLHSIYIESELKKIRALENKIWDLQAQRQDYIYGHFVPYTAVATRGFREVVKRERDGISD